MPKLPRDLTPKQVVNALKKIGYSVDYQTGSHIILYPEKANQPLLSIPNHKYIKIGLLRKLIKDINITIDEFLGLLK
jgi:predicted RNA binding protein YcfA (HicA-like mRNA interferase family)